MAKKKKKQPEPELNIKQRFDNVKILVETSRPKEAIAAIKPAQPSESQSAV